MSEAAGLRERCDFSLIWSAARRNTWHRQTNACSLQVSAWPRPPIWPNNPELGERVDAFVARFGRLQDTLAGVLLPRLLEVLLEPVGSVLDNLIRVERLGWITSASDWAELRLLRNRMVHEYVRDMQELVDALQAAHSGVADLTAVASVLAERAQHSICIASPSPPGFTACITDHLAVMQAGRIVEQGANEAVL